MATTAQVPIEVYLHSSYEPDAEYVDGEIEERAAGEYDHASWQRVILKWFLAHEGDWNVRVFPELRVQVSEARYRVPDVVVVDHALPVEQILTHPPLAVCEILSPEDSITRVLVKLRDYEEMGIATIVVVDPKGRRLYQYKNGSLEGFAAGVQPVGDGRCSIDWRVVEGYLR
jgi:Uma2 family endonuclease